MRTLKLQDMIYAGKPDENQVDRIVEYHMDPINEIGHSVHIDHVVCYRSKKYEAMNRRRPVTDTIFTEYPVLVGRNYWSQHCFEKSDKQPDGLGACDISSRNLLSLASLLVEHTSYCRYAYYHHKNFIHCDYAHEYDEPKYYGSDWRELSEQEYFDRIYKYTL